jgi:hypothetical protein
MPTALQMITRSMRLAKVIGKGETLDDDESTDGLTALNAMLDSWQLERLSVYQITQGSYSWAGALASKTIGSGGAISAQRPVRIDSAFFTDSGSQWHELTVLQDRAEYDAFVIKTTQSSTPQYLFMDPAYPLATIYLYPVPSSTITLKLNTWQTLQSFSALTTDLALPPGYQRAIEFNLAIEFGAEFGVDVPKDVRVIAIQSKAAVKNLNMPSMVARLDTAVSAGRYNIYADR